MGVYRTPDSRFDHLPDFDFQPHYLDQDGLRMHYLDEGEGDPVLLLHGEPTWSFLYRKMIPPLAAVARCVAPDYFGFGRSDKPTERSWYSYDRHVGSITRLVHELDLRRITLVVQDWGGPVGFRFAVENPERVARIVIMNTGIGARAPSDEWLRFQSFMRRVGTEIVAGQLIRLSLMQPTTDEIIAAYDAPFPDEAAKAGPRAMPTLVPTRPDDPAAEANRAAWAALGESRTPFLTAFSDSDPISGGMEAILQQHVPGAAGLDHPTLQRAGHFLQEDAGPELGAAIAAIMSAAPPR